MIESGTLNTYAARYVFSLPPYQGGIEGGRASARGEISFRQDLPQPLLGKEGG